MPDAAEDIGVQDLIADIVGRAAPALSVELVCSAVVEPVRLLIPIDSRVMHGLAAVRALEKPCEDLGSSVPLASASVVDLLLYPVKDILGNDGLVRVLDPDPLLRRVANVLFALVGDLRLLVVDGVPDIGLARQDLLDLFDRPDAWVIVPSFVKMREGPVPFVVHPPGCRDALFGQNGRDMPRARSVYGQIEDLFDDPSGLLIDHESVGRVRTSLVSERRMREHDLAREELRFLRGLHFPAGVLGVPFVEQVLEGNEVAQAFFGVLILRDGDVADMLFRKQELQIIVHHHMLSPETRQIFRDDAVDLFKGDFCTVTGQEYYRWDGVDYPSYEEYSAAKNRDFDKDSAQSLNNLKSYSEICKQIKDY